MKNLLPLVSNETLEQRAKTLIDTSHSEAAACEASEREMSLIEKENPNIHTVIKYYSNIISLIFGKMAGAMSRVHMVSLYLLLRSQAEADKMKEEIKL